MAMGPGVEYGVVPTPRLVATFHGRQAGGIALFVSIHTNTGGFFMKLKK